MSAAYPATRLRRTRVAGWSRRLHAETRLSAADLIWPLFVTSGNGVQEPIATLPGVSRWSIDGILVRAGEAREVGIPCVALFPHTPAALRTSDAREAFNPNNLICQAIGALKAAFPDLGVVADVALDPYTSHGHDGLVDERGYVENDATVQVLARQALNQAAAGADVLLPSDMMDGRVASIRQSLEAEALVNVQIMACSAKFASGLYGPFRDAVGTRGLFRGDKRTYQVDQANIEEALREATLDLEEGADSILVKPGLPYLDVIARLKAELQIPVFAYQVSGEYAMIETAAAVGAIERDDMILETLIAFKRAGCTGVLSYHALDAARLLAS
jgi:porphobilinogen synthase